MEHMTLTTEEKTTIDLSQKIQGWGVDLDPAVRPGVPRDKAPFIGVETLYPEIEQQIPKVKIHKSTEHGRLTPIFGTSCPPSGVSGRIRDYAYTLSEGRLSHWMLLIFADRVNVVEDFFIDLAHGHIPNIPKEMGIGAELKYNKKNFLTKVALVGVGVVALSVLLKRKEAGHEARDRSEGDGRS